MSRKLLYVIPTMHCNLDCNHCFIKNTPETYDREKFLDTLNNFDGELLLFGGESTIYLDRMFDIIESNNLNGKSKICSISTNLIILNDDLLGFYKTLRGVSTSWNPTRFNSIQYEIWKKHCNILSDNDIGYIVMVTLTNDLFEMSAEEFLTLAKEWVTPTLKEIKFEYYVGEGVTPEYFYKADQWLCEIYKKWDLPVFLEILNRLDCWNYNCNEIYTLYPDGNLVNSCPHGKPGIISSDCYSCEKVTKCRPCRLQPYCSYPHKLSKLVNEHKGDVSI